MKKQLTLTLLVAVCVAAAFACNKEEAPQEQGTPVEQAVKPFIITKLSAPSQQKAVAFDHNAHKRKAAATGKGCKSCHHKGKINEKCSAKGCHSGPGAEKLVHKKCYGECHLTAATAPKQAQCAACHRM
ncbi:MAG TPA: cytochrome c3 family protein [Spirochaetota bacterium]|nr:cytochrome c3 family protein [Spirochaetota bacterium]HOD14584.1 cytochrome c3 family protein [Spirochaetota bacterium]HPG51003.1 cytochrome c3 family protein [Spirochaetota bacterium]HPN13160.1 cytochrome c3 family protein [Spirochaetota bacterium]HQL83698.1 cytochrome c3 family protein [Spirochaetota bacterium]